MTAVTRRNFLVSAAATPVLVVAGKRAAATPASGAPASAAPPGGALDEFPVDEVVGTGHRFFGSIAKGLAEAVQEAARRWGLPNAYILGQEASGAFIGGLRYGEGKITTRNAGSQRVYWQGPSVGFDWGADGDRTMMLVYNLPAVGAIYQRFGGVDGSAYFIGGVGVTELNAQGVIVAPIRTGVGARLGINVSYLKFTEQATWNPF